jgi:hypothetical protein
MAPGKRLLGCLLLVLSLAANAASDIDPAGRYVLNGVREMDSALLIRSDGTFAASLDYGNVEGRVQGRWQRQGETLILQGAQGHLEIAELINGTRLTLDGACLLRDMGTYQACYLRQPELPYDDWRLGFFAPDYMDVWVETTDVTDVRGITFREAVAGSVSIRQPEDGSGEPAGWPGPYIRGKGRNFQGIDLPARIFIRWQSLAEPQTYRVTLDIPTKARALMLEPERVKCPISGWGVRYRNAITIGLAPGGTVKLWVNGACFPATEILRAQAEIEPLGPYGGRSGGKHRSLEPAAKAYIEKHGVPYGSW